MRWARAGVGSRAIPFQLGVSASVRGSRTFRWRTGAFAKNGGRGECKTVGVSQPFMDSAFMHNKKRYLIFLQQLRSRGILNFVERANSRAGVFFVWKSSKTELRWIIDARPGNMFFKAPLRWLCVLQRLFQGSRLNDTISVRSTNSGSLLSLPASSAAGSC